MRKFFYPVACLILLVACGVNFFQTFQKLTYEVFLEMPTSKGTILIDAGHGGEDPGATSLVGILEKDINLQIALILQELLENHGYEVVMTRTDDSDLADSSLETVAQRKTSDLVNRVELINSSGADLVISIHQNYFEESQYSGAQCFYYSDDSKILAEIIQESLITNLDTSNTRLASFVDNKYILNNSLIPVTIVECGFLSNINESELLNDQYYQSQIANAIMVGIDEYMVTLNS
ncbi:MAG: N-acetylmuramoyl-L-alanine amidase CwlD [Clostridia bacterium]